jgi:hypothetical protein
MKSNYSFNAELISCKKFTASQLEKIKTGLESRENYSQFYQIFLDCIEINFNDCVEIYVEEFPFELDLSSDIEKMIKEIDDIVPGGWSSDSKIEFNSIVPALTYAWYKDGKKWKEVVKKLESESFFSVWEDSSEDYSNDNSYSNYDEESEW